jgi:hypothetical protein
MKASHPLQLNTEGARFFFGSSVSDLLALAFFLHTFSSESFRFDLKSSKISFKSSSTSIFDSKT